MRLLPMLLTTSLATAAVTGLAGGIGAMPGAFADEREPERSGTGTSPGEPVAGDAEAGRPA